MCAPRYVEFLWPVGPAAESATLPAVVIPAPFTVSVPEVVETVTFPLPDDVLMPVSLMIVVLPAFSVTLPVETKPNWLTVSVPPDVSEMFPARFTALTAPPAVMLSVPVPVLTVRLVRPTELPVMLAMVTVSLPEGVDVLTESVVVLRT